MAAIDQPELSNEFEGPDLVDEVDARHGWFATVADASGHGVAAGVIFGDRDRPLS